MRFKQWLSEGVIDRSVIDKIIVLATREFPGGRTTPIQLDRVNQNGTRESRSSGFLYEAEFAGREIVLKIYPSEPYESPSVTGSSVPPASQFGHGFVEFSFYDPNFYGDQEAFQSVGSQVQSGSKAIMDKLKILWSELRSLGVSVAYHPMERPPEQLVAAPPKRTADQRGRIYSKMLNRLGYQQNYQGKHRTVWEPQQSPE